MRQTLTSFVTIAIILVWSPMAIAGENGLRNLSASSIDKELVTVAPPYKNPTLSGLFSLVIPGAGHAYQGKWGKAGIFAGIEAGLLTSALTMKVETRNDDMLRANLSRVFLNTHFYNVYASYQDARISNKNKNYNTPISKRSVVDLLTAPVNLDIITRPTFLLPMGIISGLVGLRLIVANGNSGVDTSTEKKIWGTSILAAQSTGIGLGEEAFFRGYLQPEFTDLFGKEWLGILSQALVFGAAHYNSGGVTLEQKLQKVLFTSWSAIYGGWLFAKNKQDLRENIAIHAWWDFIILGSMFLTQGEAAPIVYSVTLPFM